MLATSAGLAGLLPTLDPAAVFASQVAGLDPATAFASLSINVIDADSPAPTAWGIGPATSVWQCPKAQPIGFFLLHNPGVLSAPLATGRSMETLVVQRVEEARTIGNAAVEPKLRTASALPMDTLILYRIARELQRAGGSVLTLETGFALGGSAVAIMSALARGSTHISIDPFQNSPVDAPVNFAAAGLNAVARVVRNATSGGARHRGAAQFVHVNESAAAGLSMLTRSHTCVDLCFLDDGHKFDDNMIEFYHCDDLLKVGGILAFHDSWMPSVKAAISWATTNLDYREVRPSAANWANFRSALQQDRREHKFDLEAPGFVIGNLVAKTIRVFVKTHADGRDWTHFEPFNTHTTPTTATPASRTVAPAGGR